MVRTLWIPLILGVKISSCSQTDWNIVMINIVIKTTSKNKDWYQVAVKWIQFSPCYGYVAIIKHASVIKLSFGKNLNGLYKKVAKWEFNNTCMCNCFSLF